MSRLAHGREAELAYRALRRRPLPHQNRGRVPSGGGGGAAPFDPTSVAWTARWSDQRTVSVTDVTQWTDLTGNGRHFTAASNFPQVGAAMNGQPTISFNGALQKFVSAVQLSAVLGGGNLTWFCAFKPAATSLCDLMNDASSWSFFRHDTNAKATLFDSGNRTATSTATLSAGTGYVTLKNGLRLPVAPAGGIACMTEAELEARRNGGA